MQHPILQTSLPHLPWMDLRLARLPGVLPLDGADWLVQDEAYGPQMAERDRLIAADTDLVYRQLPEGCPAADELYAMTLALLAQRPGFRIGAQSALRPDGTEIALDPGQPLLTLGHLVQEDLCVMERSGEEHRLTGAILCFPASWHLHDRVVLTPGPGAFARDSVAGRFRAMRRNGQGDRVDRATPSPWFGRRSRRPLCPSVRSGSPQSRSALEE